jgi:hypothetical protein
MTCRTGSIAHLMSCSPRGVILIGHNRTYDPF